MIQIAYENNGRIIQVMNGVVDEKTTDIGKEYNIIEGSANDLTQYVKDGKITDRPTMSLTIDKTSITANGTDKVTITGIPKDTTVHCGSNTTTVTDGILEFTTEVPGKYVLKFENFPYQEMEVEIDAT